ncbi:gluconokinase [Lewinella sp. LCG006]|uniref:gluconokinase n=1 Tax=Lewinella sp. LCG006 TaxID=3231911 RepID=UPI00345FDF24
MPSIYIIMGVSGSGKSTIAQALSTRTQLPFFDADDFHPAANIAKMAAGQALNDDDRQPWLETLNALLKQQTQNGEGAILACSALKASYRHTLEKDLDTPPFLVYLKGSPELIAARMQARTGHFMPPALLASQFAALEEPQDALLVTIDQSIDQIVTHILTGF